jgi:amphi-Trp domain-containing protein
MELLEIKNRERLPREVVAARLRSLADDLSKHNQLEFKSGATTMRVRVADELEVNVELEVEDDEVELEIELKW